MEEGAARGVRLNRWIAESGYCSRREADRLICEGQVTLAGRVGALGDRVLPGMEVLVRGLPVAPKDRSQKVYLALNKPRGIVCTADEREPMNVVDYLHHPERLFPIGRLDKNSQGLLLMTNDGEIVNKLLRAAGGHEKEYLVTVNHPLSERFLRGMAEGVPILDTVTLPCRVERIDRYNFRIVLVQGLNRQIRRMCEAFDYRVLALTRVRIMHILLGDLLPGQYRYLTPEEIEGLTNL